MEQQEQDLPQLSPEETAKRESYDEMEYAQAMNQLASQNLPEDNLIKWQLDIKTDLQMMYHLLKGDRLVMNEKNEPTFSPPTKKILLRRVKVKDEDIIYWLRDYPKDNTSVEGSSVVKIEQVGEDGKKSMIEINTQLGKELIASLTGKEFILIGYKVEDVIDESQIPLNEVGVSYVMEQLAMYLNRNTLLSNYGEQMINDKMKDFYENTIDEIFCRYEEFGMDTPEKQKIYMRLCNTMVNTVHSAYLRALKGGERESLRTARTVTQTEATGAGGARAMPQQRQGRGILGGRGLLR